MLPRYIQILLAIVLGAVLVLAFAPYAQAWLVVPVVAVFLHLIWQTSTVKQATLLGYAFGLGVMGFGVFWLHISIAQFGGVSLLLAIAATGLFIAVIAVYFALFAGLLRITRHKNIFMLGAAPLLWMLVEWLRSWLLTGFPWLSIGYSQIDLPLAGYAPIFGVFGLGALVLLSAGLLNLWRQGWPVIAVLVLWFGGWVLDQKEWTEPGGESFQASVLQGNIAQKDKWKRSQRAETRRRYLEMTQQVKNSRLVVWPETAIPAFDTEVEDSWLQPIHTRMQQQQRDLLTGIVVQKADGRYYNAMISLGVSGRAQYLKRHLVPFGEYLPFKAMLAPVLGFMQIPMSDFSMGSHEHKPLMSLAGHQAGISICYEDAFGSEVLRALPEAGYLINASNDAWFGDSLAPHQHLQMARMRALEAGRYLLRATNTGISAIIDHRGIVQRRAENFTQATLTAQIQTRTGVTPYTHWGDVPLLLGALGLLLILWFVGRRSLKTTELLY